MTNREFERLYDEHAQSLFGFLAYRTGDRQLAEDLLADTFERALRTPRGLDLRRGNGKSWLFTIALNCLRDQRRRQAAESRAMERSAVAVGVEAPPRVLESVEDRDTVGRALTVLSDEERESVALRFGADLTVPEIARLTGEPLTTVEGRVYRALRKLRHELR